MRKMARASLLALLVAAAAWPAPAGAQGGSFSIPVWFNWDKLELDVVIVPPEHGQIYNANGVFGGEGPGELTTNNTYMKAIEASIADWDKAIQQFGSEQLRESVKTNVYVLGRDSEAAGKLASAEILVVTDQSKAQVLGIALAAYPCIVNNSKMFVSSFTYADMYNTNGQEYGHCLGMLHVLDDQPVLDIMNGHYPHNIGAKDNPLHCISNLDVLALEYVFFGGATHAVMSPGEYRTMNCTGKVATGRRKPR